MMRKISRMQLTAVVLGVGLLAALLSSQQESIQAQPLPAGVDVGAVCPLSEGQTQKAMAVFSKIASTFTDQPRCVNCHGGVDPFAADGGGHVGGKYEIKYMAVPDAGGTKVSTQIDVDASFAQCQECHSELAGWRLAPRSMFFKGKDTVTLCKQMRTNFDDSGQFIGHIDYDNGGTAFIETGFAGTRALNDAGQAIMDRPYKPEPPVGVSHGDLNGWAGDWPNAMGGEFRPPTDCGCVQHHYALQFDESADYTLNEIHMTGSSHVQVPLTFKDDGSFSGQGQAPRITTGTMTNGICKIDLNLSISIQVSGQAEAGSPPFANPPTLHVKTTWNLPASSGTATCTFGPISRSQPFSTQADDSKSRPSGLDQFDLKGDVGEQKVVQMPPPPANQTIKVTIVELD